MPENQRKIPFAVKVRLDQAQKKELPDLMLYAFDANGQLIATNPLPKGERSEVKLELPAELAETTLRIVLGPSRPKQQEEVPKWMDRLIRQGEFQEEKPSLPGVIRRGGYEKRVRLTEGGVLDLVVLPSEWTTWLLCPCVVRGRLVKRVPLPDGTTKELGVCHACIKIYEVDKIPRIILQLPERDLFRLRDDLWRILRKPPLPDPPEFLSAGSFAEKVGQIGPQTAGVTETALTLGSPVVTPVIPLPPPAPRSSLKAESQPLNEQLRTELEPVFRTASASQLRSELVANAQALAVHICALKWLWYWLHKDLIKCVCTDEQGRFETTIWYPCTGDKPDLYFKAVQCIGGSLHVLYDPGVACHTYWDYPCGTEVLLETHDPAAITCVPLDPIDPPPGVTLWVMPYAVGSVRLDAIKSSGLTDFTDAKGTWINVPFGGTLGFRHGYSSGIPYDIAGKPAYYRWLYNKLGSGDAETEWREFAAPVASTVVRHYVDYDETHPELPPTFPVYPLGPQEKNSMNLYEFKPHQPPQIPNHKREWPVDDWFADIYSGILQSPSLPGGVVDAAGKYKIKLEIYDKAGNRISPAPGSFDFIVPTGLAADGVTVLTRKAYASEIQDDGFIFYLHVDNNECEAEIYEAAVDGVPAGPCGFIAYGPGDDVHLSFRAYHRNGFARFKFTVVRGSSGYVATACAPADPTVALATAPLVTDTPVNGFNRSPTSVFAKEVDEAAIRGGCPKAAFGENLYVAATATNGWVRLSGLDASALPKAFALEPKTT
jgi:hypothetical protein